MLLAIIICTAVTVALVIPWVRCIDKEIQYRKDHPEYDPDDDEFWPPLEKADDEKDEDE